MASEKYVIALDQGTTSSRAVLINREGRMVDCVQRPFQQIFPKPGWVEHNPQDILYSQLGSLTELLAKRGLSTTSARPPSCGTPPPDSPSTTPLSGSVVARQTSWSSSAERRRRVR